MIQEFRDFVNNGDVVDRTSTGIELLTESRDELRAGARSAVGGDEPPTTPAA